MVHWLSTVLSGRMCISTSAFPLPSHEEIQKEWRKVLAGTKCAPHMGLEQCLIPGPGGGGEGDGKIPL